MSTIKSLCGFAAILLMLGAGGVAQAALLTFDFSTIGIGLETRNNLAATDEQRLYTGTEVISGRFVYDTAAQIIFTDPTTGVYSALVSLQGSVDGQGFSDPGGIAVIQNDAPFPAGCGDPPAPPCQGIQDRAILLADSNLVQNLAGFSREDGTATLFALVNVSIFWVGDSTTIDDTALPGALPPAGFNPAGLRLDFAEVGNPDNRHSVFGDGLSLAPVPVPAAVWLFTSGLGLLGLRIRRRRV